MAEPVWGMLQKAQDDSETIEQAIARLIAEHNTNEEAHLGVGQSLQSHKASEIIDHLAQSVVADKVKDGEITTPKLLDTRFIVRSYFESLDAWEQFKTGSRGTIVISSVSDLTFNLGSQANDYLALYFINEFLGTNLIPRKPLLEIVAYLNDPTYLNFITFVGNDWARSLDGGFGFIWKASESKFYAWWKDGATLYEEELAGIDEDYPHRFRCELLDDGIHFSVDGALLYTATENLPTYTDEFSVGLAFQAIDTSTPQGRASSLLYVQDQPV